MNLFLLLVLLYSSNIPAANAKEGTATTIPTLRWASTGGGWRSHFACAGFANLFANLKPNADSDDDVLSKISAISTTSGASWFSTQLFYSQEFYNAVVLAKDSQSLHDFVVDWMNAYGQMLTDSIKEVDEGVCNVTNLGEKENIQILTDLCKTLLYFDGDWAAFVEKMLEYVAVSYGDTSDDFIGRNAGSENRLEVWKETDLLIQSALLANSRIRTAAAEEDDIAVYLGTGDSSRKDLYTVPISAAYVVNASGSRFQYSTDTFGDEISVHSSPTSRDHSHEDWQDFHLWPMDNGTSLIDGGQILASGAAAAGTAEDLPAGKFSQPFGGGATSTIVQVASISSAAIGTNSPLGPSAFTQALSIEHYELEQEGLTDARVRAFEKGVDRMYNNTLLDKVAVCTQWPNDCGEQDGQFVDGWIADNPALAINVGQYHISGGDLGEILKVILTNTNKEWGSSEFDYTQFLQYFDSPINEGVQPGFFNWPPGMWIPYQSPQLFAEFMDASSLDDLIKPIEGSNMTTAILKGTTIVNSIFGVKAGQKVEILLINLNEPITTYVATPGLVEYFTEPMANMATHIAENEELASRVKAFVEPLFESKDASTSGQSALQGGCFLMVLALSSVLFF